MRIKPIAFSGPLSERRFRTLFFASSASVFGDNLVDVALAFAVLDLTGSVTDLGGVLAARTVTLIAFFLAGGVWADRMPRQVLMMLSDVGRAVTQGLMAILLLTGAAELWHFFVVEAMNGMATAFFQPASVGLTPKTISPGRLQQANALLSLTHSISSIGGPAVAGLVVASAGPGWALGADACTFLVSALFLTRIDLPPSAQKLERSSFWSDVKGGWREVRSRTWVSVSILNFMAFQFMILPVFFVLGPVIADRYYDGASSWAAILALSGVGSVLGDLLALRLRPRHPLRIVFLITLIEIPVLVLLGIRSPVPLVAAAAIPWGIAFTVGGTLWFTALQNHIPDAALARVSSYDWLGSTALRPIGFALVGPLAQWVGIKTTVIGAALVMAAVEILTVLVPDVWNLGREPATE